MRVFRDRPPWGRLPTALIVGLLLAAPGCQDEIPVSAEVTRVRGVPPNVVEVTIGIRNDGPEATDVRCEVVAVGAAGGRASFTVVEPAVGPGEVRTSTNRGPGSSDDDYDLDDVEVTCEPA